VEDLKDTLITTTGNVKSRLLKLLQNGGRCMKKTSKGYKRLSVALGFLGFLIIWIALIADGGPHTEGMTWYVVIGLCFLVSALGFVPIWGLMRLTYLIVYWVKSGFESDKNSSTR
jgi:hypothetical protein